MKRLALDLETWHPMVDVGGALQPWREGFVITSYSAAFESKGLSFRTVWLPSDTDYSWLTVNGEGARIYGWNLIFDLGCLLCVRPELRNWIFSVQWVDGRLLWKRVDQMRRQYDTPRKRYGLKDAVAEFLPDRSGYQDSVEFIGPDYDADSPEVRRLLEYNEMDTRSTFDLCEMFWARLDKQERAAALVECSAIPAIAESWVNGIGINRQAIIDLAHSASSQARHARASIGVESTVLNSPKQLGELLYDQWGLPVLNTTEKGAQSTNASTLTALALSHPQVQSVLDYQEASTVLSKFVQATVKSLEFCGNGKVYPQPQMAGTYTGRVTYESKLFKKHPVGIAIHQWKRDAPTRRIIEVGSDRQLLELDFAGQEMRLIADWSQDPVMLNGFREGHDLHAAMGARFAGRTYDDFLADLKNGDATAKQMRTLGKVANLSLQYRTGAKRLREVALVQYGLTISESQAYEYHQSYRQLYEGVPVWWQQAINLAKERGYAETRGGRKVALSNWVSNDGWPSEQTAINFPVQGTGGDLKVLALFAVKQFCYDNDVYLLFDLHDGLFFDVPRSGAAALAREMRRLMSNLPYGLLGWEPTVKLPVEAKLGPNWGGLSNVD